MKPFLGRRITYWLVGWLVAFQTGLFQTDATLFAAQLPNAPEPLPLRIGVFRAAGPLSEETDRAYGLVQRRLQRWLENQGSVQATVDVIEGSVPTEVLQQELARTRLDRDVGQLLSQLDSGAEGTVRIFQQVKALHGSLADKLSYGPSLQRASLAEAAYSWSQKNISEVARFLRGAMRLSPEPSVPNLSAWDSESTRFDLAGFEAEEATIASHLPRECRIDLDVAPDTQVRVNGFDQAAQRSFSLDVGTPYDFVFWSSGYGPVEKEVSCARAEHKRLTVRLTPGGNESVPMVLRRGGLAPMEGVSTVCLVQANRDEFRFYYLTPRGGGELPLERPIKIAEVLREPADGSLPIATDALAPLWQSRMDTPPDTPVDLAIPIDSPKLQASSLDMREKQPQWYNNWKVWAVVGVVAGGLAVAYFATRPAQVRSTNGGLTLKLQIP